MRDLKIANINGKGYELGIQFSQLFTNTIKNDFTYFKELLKSEKVRKNLEYIAEPLDEEIERHTKELKKLEKELMQKLSPALPYGIQE